MIDQGVFHNDVIAVSNQNVLFHHQHAFLNQSEALAEIRKKWRALGQEFVSIEVPNPACFCERCGRYVFVQ